MVIVGGGKRGAASTRIVSLAAFPAPPSVELTALVVLRKLPAFVASTFTLKMQLALSNNVAPDRLTVPDPAVAVMVPPPQSPDNPLGVATANPPGSISVKADTGQRESGIGVGQNKVQTRDLIADNARGKELGDRRW